MSADGISPPRRASLFPNTAHRLHRDSGIFPTYFIFPDSYRGIYTNAWSEGSSKEPKDNKI